MTYILTLLPYVGVVALIYLIYRLLNQVGDFYKKRSFWISWVVMSLLLIGLLYYIVLKGLHMI